MTTTENAPTDHPTTDTGLADGDPRRSFAKAWATSAAIATAIRPDQLADPTPCTEYDVDQLRRHLFSVGHRVACLGRGGDPFSVPEVAEDVAGDDWAAAWAEAGQEVQSAWADEATLSTIITLPWAQMPGAATLAMYVNEVTVHTWDLAVATGQAPEWDEAVLALGFEAIQIGLPAGDRTEQYDAIRDDMPEGMEGFTPPFAAAVHVADGAPLIDRLVAWNGRNPAWPA